MQVADADGNNYISLPMDMASAATLQAGGEQVRQPWVTSASNGAALYSAQHMFDEMSKIR
jgi:hypothetical protein